MASLVIFSGVPMGAVAVFSKSLAALVLTAPADPRTAPPTDKGTANAAEVTCPEAAMLCPALTLA